MRQTRRPESALTGSILQILYFLLVLLFPLALYCLALSYLNRGRRPVLVPGVWDCALLLFALSGFFLWTVPALVRSLLFPLLNRLGADIDVTQTEWLLSLAYYVVVVLTALLLLTIRRHKTAIYNVDTERFGPCLAMTLAELGLDFLQRADRLVIAPADAFTSVTAETFTAAPIAGERPTKHLNRAPGGPYYAELVVDPFATFCHVTLHWGSYSRPLRRAIEGRLTHTLENAHAMENPASGCLLSFGGMIFGVLTMLAVFFVVLSIWQRR